MTNSLIDVVIADHREVEKVFAELESGQGSPRHRRDVADHVIAELVRHSVAEEQYGRLAPRSSSTIWARRCSKANRWRLRIRTVGAA